MLRRSIILAGAVLLLSTPLSAQPQLHHPAPGASAQSSFRPNYALAERFSQARVNAMVFSTTVEPHWFKDSSKFWYRYTTSSGTRYYIVDPVSGSKNEVFDMDKLAMELTTIVKDPFDAQHIPITKLELEDDAYFRFQIRSTVDVRDEDDSTKTVKKIHYFRYDIASRKLEEVKKKVDRYPDFVNVSPDGLTGVYVKNFNLYCMDTTSMRKAAKNPKDSTIVERQLTSDGTYHFGWGVDNYKGNTVTDSTKRTFPDIKWAPDSKHFATIKWDMSRIKEFWVINSLSQPRPTLETYHYQMPGEPSPIGHLFVFTMPDGKFRPVASHAFKGQEMDIYSDIRRPVDAYNTFRGRRWLGDETGFYLSRQSRDLKRYDLCWVGVDADSTHVVAKERMNTYVETRAPRFVRGGNAFVEWSERNGWANLYLYSKDGEHLNTIVEGPFHVDEVLGVSEAAGYVLFSACGIEKGENPYQLHVYKAPLGGGTPVRLDMPDMNVAAAASFDARYFVANYSRVDAKPASALYNAMTGRKVVELEEADFSLLFEAGYKFPERFKVKAADGVTDLYGAMYKPFDFDSTRVYPIADYVYPGPQVEANNIAWSRGFTRTDRLAQLGIVVITVGNRGGHPNRSKWYHNYGYGNLRDYGLADQKYAIQQLCARHPYLDGERVGIHGHSGGGFMSTAAILTFPDFFKVAVSCAGNHDNSIYNRWWSEQHHGIQEKVAKRDTTFAYSIKTNPEIARNLKGHLLLVHGDIDDNVHPANTIRVVNALIKANKRFDLLYLPGQRHGFGDMNEYFFWKMADYYSEWLIGSSKRDMVDISELNNDIGR